MRDFIEGLKASDNFADYLFEHKKETLKFAGFAVAILTLAMLFLYRGGSEVDIVESAKTADGGTENSRSIEGDASSSDHSDANGSGQAGTLSEGSGQTGAVQTGDIYVDIGGAVKSPMLAVLPPGSRVEDAINKAGGLTSDADLNTINRAEVLVDGQKVYIPKKGETGIDTGGVSSGTGSGATSGVTSGSAGSSASGKVNINLADSTQLQTITGVGPATAQKILDYRTRNGRFNSIEDLKNVSGIGDKTFEKMRDQVTV